MKAISIGKKFEIYEDTLKTYDQLPVQTYVVRFSKMSGFYLEQYSNIEVNESKIYGDHIGKVGKVLKTFNAFERSLGVILSGNKGIGKSLFAKLLSMEAINTGLPVIIVDECIPGIASYIESIEQEVVILFDEFDKTFASRRSIEGENDPQAALLSLFDGIAQGKKLFIVTCNEIRNLNEYLINRPGRFHYHFRFEYPSPTEVKTYLEDKLSPEFYNQIDKVVTFSRKVNLNYDCLRAIAFELNLGESFADIIQDLNIVNTNTGKYDVSLHFEGGKVLYTKNRYVDLFNNDDMYMDFNYSCEDIRVLFNPTNCIYDSLKGVNIIHSDNFSVDYTYIAEEIAEEIKGLKPMYMSFVKAKDKDLHYTV